MARVTVLMITLLMLLSSFSLCFEASGQDVHAANHHHHHPHHRHRRAHHPADHPQNNDINPTSVLEIKKSPALAVSSSVKALKLGDFGANNGKDSTKAFTKAWNQACSSKGDVLLLVPKDKTYRLKPITFSGPCQSRITLQIDGKVQATTDFGDYEGQGQQYWILFEGIKDLTLQGSGVINGNGMKWWAKSCKIDKSLPCTSPPTAVTFYNCNNLRVTDLTFRNAQKMHLSFQTCTNVKASHLKVIAPGNSPNTDGIHVTNTQNIWIDKSLIQTGDDCISIVSGSRHVKATDITCGPGHGISIGSLGAGQAEAHVSDVYVDRARLTGTTNGVRIKTWQGGSGYAKNIHFSNVMMTNVSNPIIIDQNYCDQKQPCHEQGSAVQISNVAYRNIIGTSASKEAIRFDCSKSFPCKSILLENVNLKPQEDDDAAMASCANIARLHKRGNVHPLCS